MIINLLFGHMVGDYILQNDWMAINKSKNGFKGILACFIHCLIYSLTIWIFVQNWSLLWLGFIFLSHYPIDRFSLAKYWCIYFKGMKKQDFNGRYIPSGFVPIVYCAIDNTFHLLIMYYGYLYLWM